MSGINILHWLHAFNLFNQRLVELNKEIKLRIILIDSSLNEKFDNISNNLEELEKNYVDPNTVIVSDTIRACLDEKIQQKICYSFNHNFRKKYYEYSKSLEK